ncbi:MAG: acyl-protein synthase [Bacteriovorax sp.]|jgi:phenylacetate-coenzyme A ligase PaaK-like adenylate-forming protein
MDKKLKVPDLDKLKTVQMICDRSSPYDDLKLNDSEFVAAMKEITSWHMEKCEFYKKLSKSQNFSADSVKSLEDCLAIPHLWAHFFKAHEVLSVPKKDIFLHLTSSGTTGQKSQIFFDEWTIRSAQRMVDSIFEKYNWITPEQPCNYVLFSYETESSSKLGTAYTDNFLCKYAPVNEVFYALKLTGSGGHEFDCFGTIEAFQKFAKQGLPVRLFGFPAFFYFALERMKKLGIPSLKLHPDSMVFLGGGWKGNADKQIAKDDFYSLVEEMLGIPNERLRDGFGSVEHCVPYVECSHHEFHVPVWSRVFIRDVETLKPLGFEEKGFLHFISPYITSMPAHSVIMGDMASLHEAKTCGCGLPTPYFRVHGRAGVSKNKSCALAASELLKGKAS